MNKMRYRNRDIKNTRLKTTLVVIAIVLLLSIFPMHIIIKASNIDMFEINAAWAAWASCITGIVGVAGYYVNKESYRPSIIGLGVGMLRGIAPVQKILKNQEDLTDPEDIPL